MTNRHESTSAHVQPVATNPSKSIPAGRHVASCKQSTPKNITAPSQRAPVSTATAQSTPMVTPPLCHTVTGFVKQAWHPSAVAHLTVVYSGDSCQKLSFAQQTLGLETAAVQSE